MGIYMEELGFTKDKIFATSQLWYAGVEEEDIPSFRERKFDDADFENAIERAIKKSYRTWRDEVWNTIDDIIVNEYKADGGHALLSPSSDAHWMSIPTEEASA